MNQNTICLLNNCVALTSKSCDDSIYLPINVLHSFAQKHAHTSSLFVNFNKLAYFTAQHCFYTD